MVDGIRRWSWAALVVVLAVAGIALPASASSAPDTVDRLEGDTRYATAVAISRDTFPESAGQVYIATGEDFPDALAGSAGIPQEGGGPILLTTRDALPAETIAEIARLGPVAIEVVGGPAAVSDAVLAELESYAPTQRIAGADRYATAAALAVRRFPPGIADTVYLASGSDFPDALAAGARAANSDDAVLLTEPAALPAATADALAELAPSRVVAVGQDAVVGDDILEEAAAAAGTVDTARLAGPTRYDTAVAVATEGRSSSPRAYLATGAGFADALSGGAAAGMQGSLLLTPGDCLPATVAAAIDRLGVERLTILGGTSAVGQEVADLVSCDGGEPPPEQPPPDDTGGLTPASRVSTAAFGPIRFGMTPEEATAAAGLPFTTDDPLGSAPSCYYGSVEDPAFAEASFLLGEGTIGSVLVFGGGFLTDTGLGVGSTADDVYGTYGDGVRAEEHVYVPDGFYLVVESPDGGGALVFETDGTADQVVTAYRAGRFPEVAYIEGCA